MNTPDLMKHHKYFVAHLVQQFGLSSSSEADISQLDEPLKTWFQWGLDGFQRAQDTFSYLKRFVVYSPGMRHLDVGCGPGYLSTTFSLNDFDSVGIDVDDLTHAKINKLDWPHKRLSFLNLDLSKDDASTLGKFDIITLDNVIEHFYSVSVMISKLKSLLTKDGIIYLIIPNSHAIDVVRSDPHYRQFGLSLLDKQDGNAVVQALTDRTSYEVNTWFSRYDVDSYYAMFRKYGFEPTLCNDFAPSDVVQRREIFSRLDVGALKTEFQVQLDSLATRLPAHLFEKLRYLIELYLLEMENDYSLVQTGIEHVNQSRLDHFLHTYVSGTWFFVLRACSETP